MPKVFRWNGLRFHFYSEVGDPHEPDYIHIRKGRDNAKFWLRPEVHMAYNRGFPAHVLTQRVAAVEQRRELIESIWNDHFA